MPVTVPKRPSSGAIFEIVVQGRGSPSRACATSRAPWSSIDRMISMRLRRWFFSAAVMMREIGLSVCSQYLSRLLERVAREEVADLRHELAGVDLARAAGRRGARWRSRPSMIESSSSGYIANPPLRNICEHAFLLIVRARRRGGGRRSVPPVAGGALLVAVVVRRRRFSSSAPMPAAPLSRPRSCGLWQVTQVTRSSSSSGSRTRRRSSYSRRFAQHRLRHRHQVVLPGVRRRPGGRRRRAPSGCR